MMDVLKWVPLLILVVLILILLVLVLSGRKGEAIIHA